MPLVRVFSAISEGWPDLMYGGIDGGRPRRTGGRELPSESAEVIRRLERAS